MSRLLLTGAFSIALSIPALAYSAGPGPKEKKRMLEQLEKGNSSTRTRIFRQLAKQRTPLNKDITKYIKELSIDSTEAEALLSYWQTTRAPNSVQATQRWLPVALGSSNTISLLQKTPQTLQNPKVTRVLYMAAEISGRTQLDAAGQATLAGLCTHPEALVANAAIASLLNQEKHHSKGYINTLNEALQHRAKLEAQLLRLLVKIGNPQSIPTIIQTGLDFAEVNPRQGAPEHVAALKKLTGKNLGTDIKKWKAWQAKEKQPN